MQTRKSVMSLVPSLLALVYFAAPARADLVSSLTTNNNGTATLVSSDTVSAQFTLNSGVTVGSAVVSLEGSATGVIPASTLIVSLVSDASGSPGTVIATATSSSGTIVNGSYNDITFNFSPTSLSAGTYWLSIHNPDSSGEDAWSINSNGATNTGTAGNVNQLLHVNGNNYGSAGIFALDAPAAVPEPGSIILLGLSTGIIGIGAFWNRRQAATPALAAV